MSTTETTTVRYFAVLHGNPDGYRTFGALPYRPGISTLVFAFEAPAQPNQEALKAYFEARYFPLRVVYVEKGETIVSKSRGAFEEAQMCASALQRIKPDVRIQTATGRELWPTPDQSDDPFQP